MRNLALILIPLILFAFCLTLDATPANGDSWGTGYFVTSYSSAGSAAGRYTRRQARVDRRAGRRAARRASFGSNGSARVVFAVPVSYGSNGSISYGSAGG